MEKLNKRIDVLGKSVAYHIKCSDTLQTIHQSNPLTPLTMKKLLPFFFLSACILAGTVQAQTIVHRYTFSGNGNDSVGSSNASLTAPGTNRETPIFVNETPTGAVGLTQSIEFGMNKASDVKSGFQLASSVLNDVASAGSVGFFVKVDQGASGGAGYVFAGLPLTNGVIVLLPNGTSNLRGVVNNQNIGDDFTATLSDWYHVALTWEVSGTDLLVNYYVDGALSGSQATIASGSVATTDIRVGGFNLSDNATNIANQFVGNIFDLQVYDGVLDATDVSYLANNAGLPIPEPSTGLLLGAALGFIALRRRR